MPISATYDEIRRIAVDEFGDIIAHAKIQRLPTGDPRKLRLHIIDKSFVDIFVSVTGRYSYHWQRPLSGGVVYRYDNAPHKIWRHIATFPKHFHDGSEDNVTESYISNQPSAAVREFCAFVRRMLQDESKRV